MQSKVAGMAEIAGVDIAGGDNDRVRRRGIKTEAISQSCIEQPLNCFVAVFVLLVLLSRIVALVSYMCVFNFARLTL